MPSGYTCVLFVCLMYGTRGKHWDVRQSLPGAALWRVSLRRHDFGYDAAVSHWLNEAKLLSLHPTRLHLFRCQIMVLPRHVRLYQRQGHVGRKTYFRTDWNCRSQWPSVARLGSAAGRLLRLQVRIPPGHWCLPLVSDVRPQVEVCATVQSCSAMQCGDFGGCTFFSALQSRLLKANTILVCAV